MAKEIRRYELALDTTDDEEAGLMKARMRVEEAQRIRREQEESFTQQGVPARNARMAEAR